MMTISGSSTSSKGLKDILLSPDDLFYLAIAGLYKIENGTQTKWKTMSVSQFNTFYDLQNAIDSIAT